MSAKKDEGVAAGEAETVDNGQQAEAADTEAGQEPEADGDEVDEEIRMETEQERRDKGYCCPKVNRQLLVSKAFYYCFFSAWGSLLPYLALYFKQLMLTPSQVGLLMGLKPFVNFLATPVWGAIVDKFHIHRLALIISMLALIIATFSMALVPGPKTQKVILENHCNRTDEMNAMMALDGEAEIDKMVLDDPQIDAHEDYWFSKSKKPWPLDFVTSFEEDMYVRYKIDASRTFTTLILIQLFGTVISSPSLALVDTATLTMLGKETHRYGKQRLTGSLGWGMGAFIVGASLKTTHRCSMSKNREIVDFIPCFYVFAVLMTIGLLVSMKFKFASKSNKKKGASLAVGLQALKEPTYLMFLFTALYLGFLMSFIKTFLFWHLKDLGGTQLLFSVISAVNCVAEVSMYFLSEKLIGKIGQVRVLYLGLVCYSIRLFYYAVLPNTWMVLLVELLPGITTAAVWAACLSYVSINSREGAQTTMQCILHGVHWGLGYGAGEVIGGILVHHYGAPATFVMFGILCIVVLLVYILINMVFGKKETPQANSDTDEHTQTDIDPNLLPKTTEGKDGAAKGAGEGSAGSSTNAEGKSNTEVDEIAEDAAEEDTHDEKAPLLKAENSKTK